MCIFSYQFPRYTETVCFRREKKCEKGYPDQPFQGAQMKEVLRQPKSTMPCATSKIKAINAIIKNHKDTVRRPRHQGAGLSVQNAQASGGCVVQMLLKHQEPQMREPLCQPKTKINCAAFIVKAISEIHRNLKLGSQIHPKHEGTTFPDENVQCQETTRSEKVNKDTRRTIKKKKRITKDNQQDSNGNVQVDKHGQKRTEVSQHDLQSPCCAECTTGLQ